ncbi:nuclear transport factor 2 family protein [Gramella jeungdoensis]|uniref:Nuclear transport factor 2 family protein n=1 Tax=Gramella jeungdoensis TaxID=708091 RepID=A0ABT0Z321_9FLAO|nr:nuclear transport factor 2 family protein [Gramella jeungdoensis]MCM8570136.1 nuclear transport factor 2 family protein [Gramella jeungdoensis]
MGSRKDFIKKINEAFASCDIEFISGSVTDDIQWKIVGDKTIAGRSDFESELGRMKQGGPMEIKVVEFINEKEKTVVEGIVEIKIEPGKYKRYAFCDVYIFKDDNSNKVKELRTYISQIKKKQ